MIKLLMSIAVITALNIPATVKASEPAQPVAIKQINLQRNLKIQKIRSQIPSEINKLKFHAYRTPYVFSGSTIYGWDCSGLVRYFYKKLGVVLPHSADKQAHIGTRVSVPNVGDIVVFAYKGSTEFYHAAIYLGDGLIINANREYGTTVIQPLTSFDKSQIRFVRVL